MGKSRTGGVYGMPVFVLGVLAVLAFAPVDDAYGQTAKLVGIYFEDPNENGIQDRGEDGISGRTIITINLADFDMTTRDVTDADGMYEFDLHPGRYLVQVFGTNTYSYISTQDGYVTTQNFPNNQESPIPEATREKMSSEEPPEGVQTDLIQQLFGDMADLRNALDELTSMVTGLDERLQSHSHDASGNTPITITWSMGEPPLVEGKISNAELVTSAVTDGFYEWERFNPGLHFERVDRGADINFVWEVEPNPDYVGLAEFDELYAGTITVVLGSYDCNGTYHQFDMDTIQDTATHEVGHLLGLDHIADTRHLMYGVDEHTHANFDDLGYSIPEGGALTYLVGERHLEDSLDGMNVELVYLRDVIVEDESRTGQYDATLVEEHDAIIGDFNRAVDVYNCLIGFESAKEVVKKEPIQKRTPFDVSE